MPLFFIVFLSVYGLANFYVIRRTIQSLLFLPDKFRYMALAFLVLCSVSYLIAKFLFANADSFIYDVFLWMGSLWFAVLLYGFIYCALVDAYRFTAYASGWISKSTPLLPMLSPAVTLTLGLVFVFLIVGYGFWNTHNLKVKALEIDIHKAGTEPRHMKVMYFSDLHLTPVNNGRVTNNLLAIAEQQKPDLILMGGDIVDDKSRHLYRYGLDKKLEQLKAPLGKFTCPGNHEYISGKSEAFAFLEKAGIRVLTDTTIIIENRLQITGRDDSSSTRTNGYKRKPIEELGQSIRHDLPAILLDHQPFNLSKTVTAGFDMQLSGHTHHGQMFPFNLLTSKIYELSWGYLKKANTHFYVSSGVGTWGAPIRTGSDCEIIIINLKY
ncbi:MAG: metallophosphoesterase [Ignavibacteriales bacterium]|nr:metallophosphoesterase [Ignavibacteriales bacterium]